MLWKSMESASANWAIFHDVALSDSSVTDFHFLFRVKSQFVSCSITHVQNGWIVISVVTCHFQPKHYPNNLNHMVDNLEVS